VPERYASLKHGLVGCWIPSVSGSGFLLPDLSGRGNNGTLTNMASDDWVSAQYGRALDFDGSNDRVDTNQSALFNFTTATSQFTISAWIYPMATSGSPFFVTKTAIGSSLGGGYYMSSFDVNGTDFSKGHVLVYGGSGIWLGKEFSLPRNKWQHVVMAVNMSLSGNSRVKGYVDSIEATTVVSQGTLTTIGTNNLNLNFGAGSAGAIPDKCQLDDIRIYNRALSESEIRILASEPGIGFKPAKKLSRFSQRFTYQPPKAKTYSVVRVKETDHANLREGLVGAWCPSIAGSGNLLPDISGYGNHGVLTNMAADDWVSAQYGRALDFLGSANQYAEIKSGSGQLTLGQVFSVCCWCRPTAAGTSVGRGIVEKYFSFAEPYISYGLQYFNTTVNSRFSFSIANGTGGGSYVNMEATNASALNTWHHIVGTYNGSVMRIYVNGLLENTFSIVANVVYNTESLAIGRWLGNNLETEGITGQVDDVRLYVRALTDSEIRLLASRPGIGLRQDRDRQTFYQTNTRAQNHSLISNMF